MAYAFEKNGNRGSLTINGDLTVSEAAELKSALMEALEATGELLVVFDDVPSMDLSCLQLMYAAKKTAEGAGKRILYQAHNCKTLRETGDAAGFARTGIGIPDDEED